MKAVDHSPFSAAALRFAEAIAKEMPEGTGISVVISNDAGRLGCASNVDPAALVRAIQGWAEEVKKKRGKA